MDEAVIRYYRQLLKEEFPNSGELEAPSVFVEAVGQKMINCGNTGNYIQLYFKIDDRRITDISYLCSCEPVANVAVEILCSLVKGMTLEEAARLSEEEFYQLLGSQSEEYSKKVRGLLEMLNEGIAIYVEKMGGKSLSIERRREPSEKPSWDGTLST
jgi:NifU-like protein involved in Fe-S cluster formation